MLQLQNHEHQVKYMMLCAGLPLRETDLSLQERLGAPYRNIRGRDIGAEQPPKLV